MSWSGRGFARVVVSAAAVLVCILTVFAAPAAASSDLSWSGPFAVDPHQQAVGLSGVSCPSTTECVGIDGLGDETTFNPQSPQNAKVAPLTSHALTAIACPSVAQCSAVDVSGAEVTFNPLSPAGAAPSTIDGVGVPLAMVCPAASQCTTVDTAGDEVTFNPLSPSGARPVSVDTGGVLVGVDCPSTAGCYAVDTAGTAILFNPQNGSPEGKPQAVDQQPATPVALSCPTGYCSLVDTGGGLHTFSPGGQGQTTIDGSGTNAVSLSGLSCLPDPSQSPELIDCAAVDVKGQMISFEATHLAANKPVLIDAGQTLTGVSCAALNQCTAVDQAGQALTFDPRSPGTPTPVVVDGQTDLNTLSCPTETQCTAMDLQGAEVTFAPGSDVALADGTVDPKASGVFGLACPTSGQCTAVDNGGREVTFNPTSPGSPTPTPIDAPNSLEGIACPAATQCTAVDGSGGELTFNPQNPGKPSVVSITAGKGLVAVACPSLTQCTALDDSGDEVTFNPESPGVPSLVEIDSSPTVDLACPSANQCTAIDSAGEQVTFFPQSHSELAAQPIDPEGKLTAVACRTATGCVAVDAAGNAFQGDPRGTEAWSSQQVSGASLPGLACPSPTKCVTVDVPGDAFNGISGPLPPVPGPLAAPSISGVAQQGKTLTTTQGLWSNQPTSYSYQWERCTLTGLRCTAITGALGPQYILTTADVGHRLRSEVWAYNITGAGPLQVSSLSRVVSPLVALALSQASLTGLALGAPKLTVKFAVPTGQPRLTTVTMWLPGGLSLSRNARRWIQVEGTRRHFHFKLRMTAHRIEILCTSRTSGLRITIPSSALKAAPPLARRARAHRLHRLMLRLVVAEDFGGTGRFALELPAH